MYMTRERTIHENINNASLVFCMRIEQKIKEPPYIPFLEVYTYGLVARFFELSENRVQNAYTSNRHIFTNDCTLISGKDLALYAINQKPLGKHYGYLCEFPNGVMANVAYSANMVFNSRALLHFAVLFEDESDVASRLTKMLDSGDYVKSGYLPTNKPWFLTVGANQAANGDAVICPFVAQQKKERILSNPKPPEKTETKVGCAKKCARVSRSGKVLKVFDSAMDAARYYEIKPHCVYSVLNGQAKTTGADKYMFKYIK